MNKLIIASFSFLILSPAFAVTPANNSALHTSVVDISGFSSDNYNQGKSIREAWSQKRKHKKATQAFQSIDFSDLSQIQEFILEFPEETAMIDSLIKLHKTTK